MTVTLGVFMYLLLALLINVPAHADDLRTAINVSSVERAAAETALQNLLFSESMFRPINTVTTTDGVTVVTK